MTDNKITREVKRAGDVMPDSRIEYCVKRSVAAAWMICVVIHGVFWKAKDKTQYKIHPDDLYIELPETLK